MENVLSAFIIIFVLLFGALSLSHAAIASQEVISQTQSEISDRMADRMHTALELVEAKTTRNRTVFEVTLRNSGSVRLADFEQWDVIARYDSGNLRVQYLTLDTTFNINADPDMAQDLLALQSWSAHIYLDASDRAEESVDPGMWNPGEELVLWIKVSPPAVQGSPVEVALATANGVGITINFQANKPPTVTTSPLTVAPLGRKTITGDLLNATDDETPDEIVYTVTNTSALQGTLSVETFTQADIDAGKLVYTHTGSGGGSFTFSVTDGQDTVEGQTFNIGISEPPTFTPSATDFPVGSENAGVITSVWLQANDVDNTPEQLTYKIATEPEQGYLNLHTFTQADIDAGRLIYTRTGETADSFSFTITDGETRIGTYTLNISPSLG
jgi:archaellum component FlaF (FlaF/FlaG flagellin family)